MVASFPRWSLFFGCSAGAVCFTWASVRRAVNANRLPAYVGAAPVLCGGGRVAAGVNCVAAAVVGDSRPRVDARTLPLPVRPICSAGGLHWWRGNINRVHRRNNSYGSHWSRALHYLPQTSMFEALRVTPGWLFVLVMSRRWLSVQRRTKPRLLSLVLTTSDEGWHGPQPNCWLNWALTDGASVFPVMMSRVCNLTTGRCFLSSVVPSWAATND